MFTQGTRPNDKKKVGTTSDQGTANNRKNTAHFAAHNFA
jgi:hypothetical protein